MYTLENAIATYCADNSLEYSEILHESDVRAYCFKKRNRYAVDDLLEAIKPALGDYHAEKFNSRNGTFVLIAKSAITEEMFNKILSKNTSDVASRLDNIFKGDISIDEAPIITKRVINEVDMDKIAAPMSPEQLKQGLFDAIKHVKAGGQTLLDALRASGIKCKWQQSGGTVNQPDGQNGMTFPYLQFFKAGEAGETNLLVVDVQELAEGKGMENAIKALVGLANNQGIGSVDAELSRADSLKAALRDASSFAPSERQKLATAAQQAPAAPQPGI